MVARENDVVCIFVSHQEIYRIKLTPSSILQTKFGRFRHSEIIGQKFGTRLLSFHDASKTAMLLEITPELNTRSISYHTQVVYCADLALASTLLNAGAGATIVESGTGSGSATGSFARSVGSMGSIYSFEKEASRARAVAAEYSDSPWVHIACRDVYEHGLIPAEKLGDCPFADGVFLDLPEPHRVLASVATVLKSGGRLVCFLPCSEQVNVAAAALTGRGFTDIGCWEVLLKPWGMYTADDATVKRGRLLKSEGKASDVAVRDFTSEFPAPMHAAFPMPQKGHTGYLLSGTCPPADEGSVEIDVYGGCSRSRG